MYLRGICIEGSDCVFGRVSSTYYWVPTACLKSVDSVFGMYLQCIGKVRATFSVDAGCLFGGIRSVFGGTVGSGFARRIREGYLQHVCRVPSACLRVPAGVRGTGICIVFRGCPRCVGRVPGRFKRVAWCVPVMLATYLGCLHCVGMVAGM